MGRRDTSAKSSKGGAIMSNPTLIDRVRWFIGGIAWDVFLWSIHMTNEQYFEQQKEDVIREIKSEQEVMRYQ